LQLRPLQSVARYIIDFATKDLLSTQQQYNIIETLLESSKFPDPATGSAWQFQALEIADTMLAKSPKDDKLEDLQMLAAIRRKALSRLVLGEVFAEPNFLIQRRPKSPRSNALYWELRLSRAQDCVQRDDFYGAEREICDYAAFYPARTSTKEQRLGKRVRFDRARFLYLAGRFEKAQPLLEQELKALRHDEKLDDSLICFLAGVHCELSNPQEALRLTQSTITGSRDRGARNRLGVLLAEVHLHLGLSSCTFGPTPSMDESARASFNKAKTICERAIVSYESIPNFDQSGPVDSVAKVDRMGYLRVVTIIARISFLEAIFDNGDLSQARCMWINVLEAAKKCGWEKPGFMEGNSHYTIGAIEICFDQIDASNRDIEYARTLLTEAGLRNTFIGLGPIWFELVGYVISMRGGSRINLPDQCS
jgi:tetratricopeptide (TPR) repeat protein